MIPVEALHAGDRTRFRELIEQYGGLVMGVVTSYVSDPDQVDDLFQEVWITVWTKRKQYQGGSWVGWLLTVARNHCTTRHRSERARIARMERVALETEEDEHAWKAEDAHERLEKEETQSLIHRALGFLSEREYQAISLRILEGKSPEEVAKIMRCTRATVRSLIRRAIDRLHEVRAVELLQEEPNGANGG